MTSSAERMRAWSGPAPLSFGFRPFFLMAPFWAALARLLANALPWQGWPPHPAAGGWIAPPGGFAVACRPILARPRKTARQSNRAAGAAK